jgi:hypothetical protein
MKLFLLSCHISFQFNSMGYSELTHIQLLEVPRDTPYGRVLSGQISETMIQAQGPQESDGSQYCCRLAQPRDEGRRAWGRTSEMDDKQPHHHDGSPSSRLLVVEVVNVLGKNHCDDEVAESHAKGTDREYGLASDAVDPKNGGDGGDEHDDTDDTSGKETSRRLAETELTENRGGVVEDLDTQSVVMIGGVTGETNGVDSTKRDIH